MKITKITEGDKKFFESLYKKHQAIGVMWNEEASRVILKMKPGHRGWTPYGTARDCGDHYIIARYSSYDRVDKKTLEVTRDVEDK